MTKAEIKDYIDKSFNQWEKADDEHDWEFIELVILSNILEYCYINKLEIPGYDLNKIFKLKEEDEDCDVNLHNIYCDIMLEHSRGEIDLPDDFKELTDYWEKVFWHEWHYDDDNQKVETI